MTDPIITIDEFAGMGDGNLVYNSGFSPEVINGKSIMTSGFTTRNLVPKSFFDTIADDISAFINIKDGDYLLSMASGKIYANDLKDDITNGLIHSITISGDTYSSTYPDIFETENTDIIYTSANHVGYAIFSEATGGSTTTLVDTTKHFGGSNQGVYDAGTTYSQYDYVYYEGVWYAAIQSTTGNLPIVAAYWLETIPNEVAVGDSVTNLTTGKEEAITSITTTTYQNDTLNFDATTATSSSDEYIAWQDDKHDLMDGITAQSWQPSTPIWKRQIKQYSNQYFILNGNYIATLSSDGNTLDNTFKQLPLRNQAMCMEVSNDKLLVSSEYKGRGKLNLWDSSTGQWANIIEFDYPVTALISYKSGWLFVSHGTLYYTDGYQIEVLSKLNLADNLIYFTDLLQPTYFNGIFYFNNKLYFASSAEDFNLVDNGVFCFDFEKGWTFIENNAGYDYIFGKERAYCIGICEYARDIVVGGESTINEIRIGYTQSYNYSNGKIPYSFINYVNLPQKTQIKGVGLNLLRPIKDYLSDRAEKKTKVYVNIGDGGRGLLDFFYISEASGTANKLKVNGTLHKNNEVGDEIIIVEDSNSESIYKGDRFFITAIENQGLATEEWTLDRNMVGTFTGDIKVLRVKNVETKEVSYDELNDEIMFMGSSFGFLSNKMFLEVVVVDDEDNPMPISISSIKIYG
jgi:hypothetical protein